MNKGDKLNHKHLEGLFIELIHITIRGWKVTQTNLFSPAGNPLRKPKTKIAFFTDEILADQFEKVEK